jgi:hypothetical protein
MFANIKSVNYTIEYFHARVKAEIESWPDGILADYARLVELLMEFESANAALASHGRRSFRVTATGT